MKIYRLVAVLGLIPIACAAPFLGRKLIDVLEKAQGQVHAFTCKVRDIALPSSKKETKELSKNLLEELQSSVKKLQIVVRGALEKDVFDKPLLDKSLKKLSEIGGKITVLEAASQESKMGLKSLSEDIVAQYSVLLDETGALDLWVQGYEAYSKDLEDNFKNLPNSILQKPDNKLLYQELGLSADSGKSASFDEIKKAYQKRFNELQKKHGRDFDDLVFRPYLRVLQYVFRTHASKKQYDAFLAGKTVYNKKKEALSKYNNLIHELFAQHLPAVRVTIVTMLSELC